MKFSVLSPEVAGDLGHNTVMDTGASGLRVDHLHYEFNTWLGDDLIEAFPCFIVSAHLKETIELAGLTGMVFDSAEVSTTQVFEDLYPARRLPVFYWLKVTGKPGVTDFGLTPDARLVVSERALAALRKHSLRNCDIGDYT
jgi:hypothetical protein